MKRKFALFLALCMVCAVLGGCGGGSERGGAEGSNGLDDERKANNEIVVAIPQDLADSLDPHGSMSAGTREILFNIYEGLVKTGPDGELIPAVAESYRISEDGLTYTFKLRDNVKFHNGAKVSAEDVIYSLQRCIKSAGNTGDSALVSALSAIGRDTLTAGDDNTVSFRIDRPDPELIYFLTVAIVPADYDQLDTAPCGTGPFRFVSRSPQENVVLEKFDDYWGEAAAIDKVTLRIYTDPTALVLALKAGSVDLCPHLTAAQTAQLGTAYTILEDTMNLVQAVYLNHAVAPLDNETVRRAMCYAINRQEIMDMVADGHGVAVGSSIYPKLTRYFLPELVDRYPYDVEKARELLAQAGYPDGFDLTIAVVSSYQPHMDTAEVVVEQLRAIGINASVQPMDSATWINDVYVGRNFQATITGVDAKNVTARAMLERFVSDNGKNFINYSNAEYDALYAQAMASASEAEQTALYRQMETLLCDTAANLYIQDLADLVAIRGDLTGLRFYPVYVLDLQTVHYE